MEKYSSNETEVSNEPLAYQENSNGVFYNLKLSKQSVDMLFNSFKKHKKRDKLIFQFFYPEETLHHSPTLGAYPMRSKNQHVDFPNFTPPILDYHDKSEEPLTGRAQFLGDQQLDVDDLKQLLNDSNKPDANAYEYLIFTTRFHDDNPHIYYDVSVQPSNTLTTRTIPTDPSPPAPAH
jgi:hypothetical protein